ncbi:fused response regulator/phosphatase [Piscinibacter sp. XHJ-5]|uniref:PP2C family protein-serine/threonine phosphatase n=1 Tax=Piscinibacter sp. XHJ-5 TaxID=3037797 RepID=UPI0024531A65|nr:fused response regulator/phosphatase [Piscinibacter sp. XHJ-5]
MNPAQAALLVVDDNEDNRYTLTRRLSREGYANIVTANDGRQALEVLRSQRVDLVLLDIAMPELNGYQVLEQMKEDAALHDIPVIMISAVDELDSVIRCIELGAEDYLAKPFNPTLLRARVGASLDKKRLRDLVRESLQRLEGEMDAARRLQLGMLPRSFPGWSPERPVRLHAFMEPARQVGGDLYDFFFPGEGVFCFLVGDVSGKGAPAALFMAHTRSLVRLTTELCQRFAPDHCTPASIARLVNQELCRDNVDRMFVTLFLAFLDTASGIVTYVNAGHPAPYVSSASGSVDRIRTRKAQPPLGVKSGLVYDAHSVRIGPGDTIFVCTDGIADATNSDEAFYTEARVESELRHAGGDTPAEMIARVKSAVDRFTGDAPKADDMTMLALRWDPVRPSRVA